MLSGLAVGEQLLRRDLHQRFGARRQGGIGPSRTAPVVLFFTDPAKGHRHGYYDGWGTDGLYQYVGGGQRGNQQLVQGNRAILNHRADGRTLEGFRSSGTLATYLGEFELIDHYFTDGHETDSPELLWQVVVFRLQPRSAVPIPLPDLPVTPAPATTVHTVPIEARHTERAFVSPDREPYEAERRESELVHRYQQHLETQGHTVSRLRVIPPGESRPLYSDLWDETTRDLVEAKGTVNRDTLRQAVGQLLDYGLATANVSVIYPNSETWQRIEATRSPEGTAAE